MNKRLDKLTGVAGNNIGGCTGISTDDSDIPTLVSIVNNRPCLASFGC